MDTQLSDSILIGKVIRRLEERQNRQALAREILKGIRESRPNPENPPFAAERDIWGGGLCSNPGGSGRFDCTASDFTCPQFTCDAQFLYSNCNGDPNAFSCNDNNFTCDNGKGGTDTFYDCMDFDCGGGVDEFHCIADYDFLCEDEFDCVNNFGCHGGHVFICSDDHRCDDFFLCSPGGNDCNAQYPYSVDEGDTTPGDFSCGWTGTDPTDTDTFDCLDVFMCNALDEFECEQTAIFSCGPGLNSQFTCQADGKGFECETTNGFECDDLFECVNVYTQMSEIPTLGPMGLAILSGLLGAAGAFAIWLNRTRGQ